MKIVYTRNFLRMLRHLPLNIQDKVCQKEIIFKKYPFSKILRTHKLSGKLSGHYAFSLDYNYRVIFKYLDKSTVAFLHVGDHSIYQ